MSERIRSLLERVGASNASTDEQSAQLRERLPARSVAALEREIASEIAHSLGRASSKLEAALAQATSARSELQASAPGSEQRQELLRLFEERSTLAERCLRNLIIQREALGFRRHTELHQRYVLPPRWRED
jgi:hypothetical protein